MSKKSIKIKNIFMIWLIICFVFNFIIILGSISNGANILELLKIKPLVLLLCAFISIILVIIFNGFIFGMIFLVRYNKNKVKKENMSEIDFKKYEGYFRDTLNKHSSAELEYVDNLCCKEKNTIVATLLKLELLKKIKINEKNIDIIDNNTDNLRKTEKYILNSIKDGKVKIDISGKIQYYAEEEAKEDRLIQKYKYSNVARNNREQQYEKKLIKSFIIFFLVCALISYFSESLYNMQDSVLKTVLIIITTVIPGVFFIYHFMIRTFSKGIYQMIKGNSYIRTKDGEELNEKIEGLKNYINKYSNMQTREKEELTLWEDYLIYSVIFNINTKIIEDISNLIEYELEYGRIYFLNNKK